MLWLDLTRETPCFLITLSSLACQDVNLNCSSKLENCVSVDTSYDSDDTTREDPFSTFPIIRATESREGLFVRPPGAATRAESSNNTWPQTDIFRDFSDESKYENNLSQMASRSRDSLDLSALSHDGEARKRGGMPNAASFGSDGLVGGTPSRGRSHIHLLESSDNEEEEKGKGRTLIEV